MPDILQAARRLHAELDERFPWVVRRLYQPVLFYIEDHRQAVIFDVARSTTGPVSAGREECHLALRSDALWYAFAHRWGFDTLDISARFQVVRGPKTPGAFRLCDAGSAGLDLRVRPFLRDAGWSVRRWWLKRGEILDMLATRLLGRAEL